MVTAIDSTKLSHRSSSTQQRSKIENHVSLYCSAFPSRISEQYLREYMRSHTYIRKYQHLILKVTSINFQYQSIRSLFGTKND